MNGQSALHETNLNELKRKAEQEGTTNGKDIRPMAHNEIKSPGPERKKLRVGANDRLVKSPVRSALNSPKITKNADVPTSPQRERSPVKLIIKRESIMPTKDHVNKSVVKSPTRLTVKKEALPLTKGSTSDKNVMVKQESKLNSPKSQPKPKPAPDSDDDDDDDIPLAKRIVNKVKVVDGKVKSASKDKKGDAKKSAKPTGHKISKDKETSQKASKEKAGKPIKGEKKSAEKIDAKKPATNTDDSDEEPLSARVNKAMSTPKVIPGNKSTGSAKKKGKQSSERKRKKSASQDSDSDDESQPLAKVARKKTVKPSKKEGERKVTTEKEKATKKAKTTCTTKVKKEEEKVGKGKKKKKEEEKEVWKWWEEQQHPDGQKWLTLEHKGPFFPPEYEPLPKSVKFYYDGKHLEISLTSEEIAGFYAKMLEHEYTAKEIFNKNFFTDWRKEMTEQERKTIKDLKKCDFKEMHKYFDMKNEERKNMTKEQKQEIKMKNEEILNEHGYCIMDGHKQRVGNFKIEPPGLFRGRGDHPKQGKLKKRVLSEDVIINIQRDCCIPDPPEGHKWKKVICDKSVTWLACWIENIQGSYKYVMLNPTSRLKGEKDWRKYETARKLKDCVHKIREGYKVDWRAKEMRVRQRGVALYFIDKLALRAGHEKDDDTADTVGCCSLRVEHIKLHPEWEDKECVVEFDFLGKDSVRYLNFVPIEKRAFKNMKLFMEGKQDGDDLFDRLTTTSLNKYLSELMEGLTAKVFRTFNASLTLQDQLKQLTDYANNVNAKILSYNRANRAVAILCNHQRTAPKTFEKSMSNLQLKISDKKTAIKESKKELKELKKKAKERRSDPVIKLVDKKKTQVERLEEQLFKLEVTATDKEENKEIALGTSKLNYLDPRITVAWCKKFEVPVEKAYNKTQREKFAWAMDMATEEFVF